MPRIPTRLDVHSEEFRQNESFNRALVEDLRREVGRAARGGSKAAIEKHRSSGKLSARERIRVLLDTGSAFLELSQLAAHGMYGGEIACAGVLTGIGRIAGRECVIVANDPTVKGGTYYPITVKKHLRAQEIARDNRLTCVYLVESGGAFLPAQDEVFPDRDNFGRIFYNQARLSALGVAQISVVHGSCTAGGAYVPAMSDENVIVRNQGRVFLGGPPLVKAATGEDIDAESLGGADVHCRESGVCDHYAENDTHALAIARRIVARLRRRSASLPPRAPVEPLHDPSELYGVLPSNPRLPYDVRELIARLSVMGGEQAASVLATVKRDQLKGSGRAWSPQEEEAFKQPIREQYERQGHPYYSSARLWDDGVIDPLETRRVLALALAALAHAPAEPAPFGVFRM